MLCPSCGYLEMEERIYDETVSHGGKSINLTQMKGQICPVCGDIVGDDVSGERYFQAQDASVIQARNRTKKKENGFLGTPAKTQAQITS